MEGYALVTGGSSGIGECYAYRLAEAGWGVIIVSNRHDENSRVVKAITSRYGVEAKMLTIDLTESDAAEQVYSWCKGWGIRVDILVNNAGMLLFSQLENSEPSQLEKIIALHCTTPTKLCRLFGGDMARRGSGRILLMSSVSAWMPYPTISHYAATKVYLKNLGQALWYEMRRRGVSVTTVFPSAVDTPLYKLDEKIRKRLLRFGVMLKADEVARKALRAMFKGRRRFIPGLLTKLEAGICWLLPSWALLPVLKIPMVKRILERV